MLQHLHSLAPSLIGVFITSWMLVGCMITSSVFVGVLLGVLFWFRIPQVSKERADAVLVPGKGSIIAHKGAAGEAPENTIAAIRLAKENGAHGIEFDVGYTSDGVPVLMHDDSVDRTTDGTGNLSELPWSKVQRLNAAAKDANRALFPEETVPLLEDAVRTCLELDLKIFFDVKGNPAESARVLPGLYRKYPKLYNMGVVCSFYPNLIYKVRQEDKDIVTALTWRPHFISRTNINGPYREQAFWKQWLMSALDVVLRWAHFTWMPLLCGNAAFLIVKDNLSRELVRHFSDLGVQVAVWTVNDKAEKKFIMETLHVPCITDFVKQ